MDFKRWWYRTCKKVRKTFKKVKRWFKRYIRLLVRHTKAKDYSVLIYTIGAVIGIVLAFVLVGKLFSAVTHIGKNKSQTTEISTPLDAMQPSTEDPKMIMANECRSVYDRNKDIMMLVNRTHSIPVGYSFEHHTLNCGLDVDERCYNDLKDMLSALNAEEMYYSIISAYRSSETQQSIIDSKKASFIGQGMSEADAYNKTLESVAPVGCSEHESGLALDIAPEGVYSLDDSIENDPSNIWLRDHCYEYGFILRYPKEKEAITGFTYEPWHFRYVGKDAAKFLHDNDLSLEEFFDYLEY